MSFLGKVVENKGTAITGTAALALLSFGFLYNSLKGEQLDLKKQIKAIRSEVNVTDPSIEDAKKIVEFSMIYARKKVRLYSEKFKKKRLTLKKEEKQNRMPEYIDFILGGLEDIEKISECLQDEILKELGINEIFFKKLQDKLGQFMEELMVKGQMEERKDIKQLSLEETSSAIQLQTKFIQKEGQSIAKKIVYMATDWSDSKKKHIPMLINIMIADGAFDKYPIDEKAVQYATKKFQQELKTQIRQLSEAMTSLMVSLNSDLQKTQMMQPQKNQIMKINQMMAGITPQQFQKLKQGEKMQQ